MKILTTSDWHLDASTAGFARFSDLCAAVDQTVETAIKERVDLYLFLGDLCDPDGNRAPRCVAKAIQAAQLLRNKMITSRWLVGNHDVIEDGSGTSTLSPLAAASTAVGHSDGSPSWVAVVDRPAIEQIDGVTFLWLPFVPRCAGYEAAEEVKTAVLQDEAAERGVVVAGHLSIVGQTPGSESQELARGRDLWLPTGAIRERWPRALVLNGHYHRAQKDPRGVLIPGALARLTFGEEDHEPGFFIVDTATHEMRWFPVQGSRALITLPLRDAVTPAWEGSIVRVCPSAGMTGEQIDQGIRIAQGRGAVAVKVVPAPLPPAVVVRDADGASPRRRGPRAVVEEMVEQAVGVDDGKALADFVQLVLESEGL